MAFFNFYCIFRIFGTRGVERTKKRNTCSEVRFFCPKVQHFLSFFSTCRQLVACRVSCQPVTPCRDIQHLQLSLLFYFRKGRTHAHIGGLKK